MLQARPRPFEGAFYRIHRRVQHVRHLGGVESEDVAQDEHGELARWQALKGGHKGQRDGLGLLAAGLRTERRVDDTLEQGVGKWL